MDINSKMTSLSAYSVSQRPPLSQPEFDLALSELQQMTKSPLPEPYTAFLRAYGAFAVDAAVKDKYLPVSVFLGFTTATDAYDLRRALKLLKEQIPDSALPMAIDDYGSCFLLDWRTGTISFWEHETQRITPLASDFTAFLDSLSPLPEDDLGE